MTGATFELGTDGPTTILAGVDGSESRTRHARAGREPNSRSGRAMQYRELLRLAQLVP